MQRLQRDPDLASAAVVIGVIFGAGPAATGATGSRPYRRTTIIPCGDRRRRALVGGRRSLVNHAAVPSPIVRADRGPCVAVAAGLFVLAGATPAAVGLLADMSERFPADRGAIMGLYSVFLALGQIVGSLIGGSPRNGAGIDGLLIATARPPGRRAPAARAAAPRRSTMLEPEHPELAPRARSDAEPAATA